MEEYININYLTPLLLSWIVSGWIVMVKKDSESTYDFVPLHDTLLYQLLSTLPIITIFISLVINIFQVGFLSTIIYIGIIVITQILNASFLYRIYRSIFGKDGIGTLIPIIAIFPLLIYMFVEQFS